MKSKKYVPLKDLCNNYKQDIVDGPFGSNLTRSDYLTDGIPVLKIQNVKPFKVVLKRMDYVSQDKYDELKRHSYANGDIVMTKLGDPLGASAIVEGLDDGLIVADIVRIRAAKIDTKYLCYHLNSPVTSKFINSLQKGTTRPRVRIDNVRNLPIYAPPLPEQQRIVSVLDEAFASIAQAKSHAERNLVNARELFESVLEDMFVNKGIGWTESRLAEFCDIKHGYAFDGKDFGTDFYGKNPIVLTPGNFSENSTLYFTQKNTKRCSGQYPKEYRFNKGDLVVVMTDLSSQMKILGKPAFIESENILHNQRIGRFVFLSDSLDKFYLYYFLQTKA